MNTQSNQLKHNQLYYNVYPTFAKYSYWLENNWDALTPGLSVHAKMDIRDGWRKSLARFDNEACLGNDTKMWEALIDHWHEMPFDGELTNAPQEWIDFYESADEFYKFWSAEPLESTQYRRPEFNEDDKLSDMFYSMYPRYALYRHWITAHFDDWVENEIKLGHAKEWLNKPREPYFFVYLREFDAAFHAADTSEMYETMLGQYCESNFSCTASTGPQEWVDFYDAVDRFHTKWKEREITRPSAQGNKQ